MKLSKQEAIAEIQRRRAVTVEVANKAAQTQRRRDIEAACIYCRLGDVVVEGRHTSRGMPFCRANSLRRAL